MYPPISPGTISWSRSKRQVASVNDKVRCGHERRLAARQKDDTVGDLLRLPDSVEDTLCAKLVIVAKVVDGAFQIGGHDGAGTDRVDPDIPRSKFDCQNFGERQDTTFGCAIVSALSPRHGRPD